MIVDVDMGNSRIKWRLYGASQVHVCGCWQDAFQQWGLLGGVTRIRISSVVALCEQQALSTAVEQRFGFHPELAQVRDDCKGLILAYKDVKTLGVDRWLAMLAARAIDLGRPWLVFSAGTALTADLVGRDGVHLGGYIVPGVHLSASILHKKTALIGLFDGVTEKNWQPGGTTLECVQSGLSAMYQSYVHAVYSQASLLLPGLCVAWSGGAGLALRDLCQLDGEEVVEPFLVLSGLSLALP